MGVKSKAQITLRLLPLNEMQCSIIFILVLVCSTCTKAAEPEDVGITTKVETPKKTDPYKPTEKISKCVEIELDPNDKDNYDYCKDALKDAVNSMEVHRLLEKGHDPNTPLDHQGRTKLIISTFAGNKDIVAELIQFGNADVNVRAETGHTAMMYAAAKGYSDLIKMFLMREGDVNLQIEGGQSEFERYKRKGEEFPYKVAKIGYTALHFAAEFGQVRAAKLLVDAGADKKIKNHFGKTAYDLAVDASKEGRLHEQTLYDLSKLVDPEPPAEEDEELSEL